jgi:hypothetical protein
LLAIRPVTVISKVFKNPVLASPVVKLGVVVADNTLDCFGLVPAAGVAIPPVTDNEGNALFASDSLADSTNITPASPIGAPLLFIISKVTFTSVGLPIFVTDTMSIVGGKIPASS